MTDLIIEPEDGTWLSLYIRDGKSRVIAVSAKGRLTVKDYEEPKGYRRALKAIRKLLEG